VVPTYFTSKRGVLAEPLAKQMAAELGIQFQSNVPEWMYDKEARKAHDIEEAKREKEEAKAEREARKAMRVAKLRQKKAELEKKKES
jgi:TfoX/Sxy family transcriptional regulator of competence genes